MNLPRTLRTLWWIAGFAFLLAAARGPFFAWLNGPIVAAGNWVTGGFQPGAVYPATERGALPEGRATVGSWIGGDAWTGTAETAWLPAPAGDVRICIAGYPNGTGCALRVELRDANGAVRRVPCELSNPMERWTAWDVPLATRGAPITALRIVAEDRGEGPGGWVAFSQPFTPEWILARPLFEAAQVLTTLALALVLVWLPGVIVAAFARSMAGRTAILIGAGPLLLAAIGVALWLVTPWVRAAIGAPTLVIALWLAIGFGLRRHAGEIEQTFTRGTRLVFGIVALTALAAVAKATFSGGPEGELFAGTIGRSLAVGNRSDSRTSFATSQLIARGLTPTDIEAEKCFTPWTFFSRGPLAGVAAAPIVLATGGRPPVESLDSFAWEPFDATGFGSYRIAMIVLAGSAIVALFGTLKLLVDERWAAIGAGVFALCPFVTHELSFTWPKLAATAWLAVSLAFAQERRALAAGLSLAVGYLFHPLALLWSPWLGLWAASREIGRARARALGTIAFGAAIVVVPWMAMALLPHHLPSTELSGQTGFVRYFLLADGLPATGPSWLHTRWLNFSNTFLPFWLPAVNHFHADINSMYAPAGPLVRFAFSWWTTLPLGLGLLTWAVGAIAIFQAARNWPAAVIALVFAPALLLVVYWGGAASGLMRECGHPLLMAIVGLAIVWFARSNGALARAAQHRLVPWLQLPETLLMLWLTTLAHPVATASGFQALDPIWFALNVAALAGAARLAVCARENSATFAPAAAIAPASVP